MFIRILSIVSFRDMGLSYIWEKYGFFKKNPLRNEMHTYRWSWLIVPQHVYWILILVTLALNVILMRHQMEVQYVINI